MKPARIILVAIPMALMLAAWWGARESSRAGNPAAASASPAKSATAAATAAASTDPANTPASVPAASLALDIERALVARDPRQRETAFASTLPDVLRADPGQAVALLARQPPGEARDALRQEIARQWIREDRDSAVAWMHTLENDAERRAAAGAAVESLAAFAPDQAIYVADQFGIGRDDGYLEHMVQMWAEADIEAATRWIETQPDDARNAPLRARIELVRGRKPPPSRS